MSECRAGVAIQFLTKTYAAQSLMHPFVPACQAKSFGNNLPRIIHSKVKTNKQKKNNGGL